MKFLKLPRIGARIGALAVLVSCSTAACGPARMEMATAGAPPKTGNNISLYLGLGGSKLCSIPFGTFQRLLGPIAKDLRFHQEFNRTWGLSTVTPAYAELLGEAQARVSELVDSIVGALSGDPGSRTKYHFAIGTWPASAKLPNLPAQIADEFQNWLLRFATDDDGATLEGADGSQDSSARSNTDEDGARSDTERETPIRIVFGTDRGSLFSELREYSYAEFLSHYIVSEPLRASPAKS